MQTVVNRRTRFVPREKLDLSKFKTFTIRGSLLYKNDRSIQIQKGNTKTTFWLETQNMENPSVLDTFTSQDKCEFTVIARTYKGRDLTIKTKLYLVEIAPLADTSLLEETVSDLTIRGNVISSMKTDIPGLYVLTVERMEGEEVKETIQVRYYTKDVPPLHPMLGLWTMDLEIMNTSRIILENGEIYSDTHDIISKEGDIETRKTIPVYVPCLSVVDSRDWEKVENK